MNQLVSRTLSRWFVPRLAALALTALALVAPPPASAAAPGRSVAVLVGANAPAPGRDALRFALGDAKLMADTLARTGRFAKDDIVTLLEPKPRQLVAELERIAAAPSEPDGPGLFVFYYSGHSDGQQLFPGGEALALTELRAVIRRLPARVRVAILDTCRGGGWTNTKGLSVGPPLRTIDLLDADTAGTALLSSSSGMENAHEAAVYGGSFFTHHVAAGLLGAADASGDGSVTLQEVFSYAKERTVRDSAHLAPTTQHPSFEIELRGRQDVVLAELAQSPSVLEITQRHAHEVVHLSSGVTAVETLPSQRLVRLALPAGAYVVRRVSDGRVLAKDVSVLPGESLRVDESELLPADERLALKGDDPAFDPPSAHDSLPASSWELRLGVGVTTGREREFGSPLFSSGAPEDAPLDRELSAVGSFTYAITDRLSWSVLLPAFAYRFGSESHVTATVRGGLTALGYSSITGAVGTVDAGLGVRAWLSPELSLISAVSSDWAFGSPDRERVLALHGSLGVAWVVSERVTLALGAGYGGGIALFDATLRVANGEPPIVLDDPVAGGLVFGAIQSLGYRPLPLLQVHVTDWLSLDAYASWAVNLDNGDVRDRALGGFTWTF
jgi:hypothetical protein